MSDLVKTEEITEALDEMVKEYHGKRNCKAMDLTKAMISKFGEDKCDKKGCKKAIRALIESARCTYSYVGGSYIVLNPDYPGDK
jgi:hypothetical protein